MPAFAAYNCRVTFGGVALHANSVTINVKSDIQDVTSFSQNIGTPVAIPTFPTAVAVGAAAGSNGYGNYVQGVIDADVTLDAFWFSDDNPYLAVGFNINPGVVVGPVVILLDSVNVNKSWSFSKMIVESLDHMEAVRETIRFTARLKNCGTLLVAPV